MDGLGQEARIAALEEECRRLNDIEGIRLLRHRYCRCVNKGEWLDLEDCFAEDSMIDFGPGIQVRGRKAVGGFYREQLSRTMALTVIHAHNPEIEVMDDTATGLWEFENFRVERPTNRAFRFGGVYEEEYVRICGEWKIKSSAVRFHFKQPVEWEEMEL